MSEQSPSDPTSSAAGEGPVDVSARLAGFTARPAVSSIWQRREAAVPVPSTAVEAVEVERPVDRQAPPAAVPPAPVPPTPAAASSPGIGRLTRVTAAELWTDAGAMAAWIAANADVLAELTGVDGLQFRAPTDGTVLGTASNGSAVCVVCEVGQSSDEGLGALLRTAAVQDGGTVVWLNGGPIDSHVAALSWLNRATASRFLLAKATGVRIDGSASAPMFELLVRPPRATEPAEEVAGAPRRRVEDHLPDR